MEAIYFLNEEVVYISNKAFDLCDMISNQNI